MLWKYYSCNIIVLLWVYNLTFFTYCHRIMCFFTYLEPLLFGSKEKWMYFFYLFLFLWMYLGPRTYDLWLLFFLQKYCGNLLIIFTLFTNRERIAHWIRWDLDTCSVFCTCVKIWTGPLLLCTGPKLLAYKSLSYDCT